MINVGTYGKSTIAQVAPGVRGEAIVKTEGLLPGQLIELVKENGVAGTPVEKMKAHATAFGPGSVMIALEDEIQGKTVDQAYAANDYAHYGVFWPGQRVLVRAATSQTIVFGDLLQSKGDGNFQKADGSHTADGCLLVVAREAINTTTGTALLVAEVL